MAPRNYLVLAIAMFSLATFADPAASEEKAHLPAAEFLLDREKIDQYRPLALAGDREKAIAIYNHYSLFEDNQIDAEFWLRVIAERNDCYAVKEYVRRLKHTPRLNTPDRLRHWTDREREACGKKPDGS